MKLSDKQRLALIIEASQAAYQTTESFYSEDHIGADLAYLLAAIARNDKVDWSLNSGDEPPALYKLLKSVLSPASGVWEFINV